MRALSKICLLSLILAIIGARSYAQSNLLYTGTHSFPDTVLVLNKEQAVKISSKLIRAKTFEQRLSASLNRESKLITLWEQTNKALKIADEAFELQQKQLLNLESQLELSDGERRRLSESMRKEKRNSLLTGTGLGVVLALLAVIALG